LRDARLRLAESPESDDGLDEEPDENGDDGGTGEE